MAKAKETDKGGERRLTVVGKSPPIGDEELRLWLQGHIEENPHLTTAVLARQIGINRARIDQYLAGKYFLPKENGGQGVDPTKSNTEPLIKAYREKIEGTERHGYTNTFVNTRTWWQIQQACTTAIAENAIVVVYGRPGVGKSRGLSQFSIKHMTTVPITILCSRNITPRYFVQKIAKLMGLDDRPTTAKLEDYIAEQLRRGPRPLFIDQANYLHEKSLGTLCYLWEIARVPIVLFGTKQLFDLFMNSRLTEDVRLQLSSRVAMHYPLEGLTVEEVKMIVERVLGKAATDEVVAAVWQATSGEHRRVDMILPRVLEIAEKAKAESGKADLTGVIAKAASRLMTA
jgi:DNA transposition AAA+ family ATPase